MFSKVGKPGQNLILAVLLILSLAYILAYFLVFKSLDTRSSSFNSIPILDKQQISEGYTLISPYNRFTRTGPGWEGKIYLLDLFGKPVHIWKTNHQALYSVLKPNGNLLVAMEEPKYNQAVPGGGNTGILQELDWESNVVWEYKNEFLHHDLVPLGNGNVVVALWEKTPAEIASRIKGGVGGTEIDGAIWSDMLAEINPKNGEIVWSWHSYDHLNPETDTITDLIPRQGWTYINGISYMEKNPIDGQEGYLLSMRSLGTVFIIRKSDGQVLWRSPKNLLNTQHDPTPLPNGNILVFDNGLYRIPNPYPVFGSRVMEINPKTNEIVWQFDGGEGAIDKVRFFSPLVGGAQRLPNGNTLITEGTQGHIFEVTPDKKVVWDLINPYQTKMTGHFPNNFLFKTRRYTEDEISWPAKIEDPLNENTLKIYQLLKPLFPQS